MSKVDTQFLSKGFHRLVFDTVPWPLLVVDNDFRVVEYNSAAAPLVGNDKRAVRGRRGGEALNCVYGVGGSNPCDPSAECSDCVLRNIVEGAAEGRAIRRRWTPFERMIGGKRLKTKLRVSAQPFNYQGRLLILLVLEGFNEEAVK
jgi:hypothetical protein